MTDIASRPQPIVHNVEAPDVLHVLHPDRRTTVFIDGPHLYSISRTLGFDVDYRRLLALFEDNTDLTRISYKSALLETEDFSPLRRLVDWLAHNGFDVETRPAREFTDATGRRRVVGRIDMALAVGMMESVVIGDARQVVLFSGDGELVPAVQMLKRQGVRVVLISTQQTTPEMMSVDLKMAADRFIELNDLVPLIEKQKG